MNNNNMLKLGLFWFAYGFTFGNTFNDKKWKVETHENFHRFEEKTT